VAARRVPSRGEPPTHADLFAGASLRLALLFAAIVVLLIAASGLIMYRSFSTDLQRAIVTPPAEGETEQEQVTRSVGHLRWQLIVIDGCIILVVGGFGLWYARRTLRPIRETYAAQKRFVADASHELRTPLAIMKTDFEVALSSGRAGEAARPYLESGLEEVDRMSLLVDDLLTLSRIDAHQEELVFSPIDMADLAREAGAKLQLLASKGGVELTVAAPAAATVSGDAAHLERAVLNVMRNAVAASPEGGAVNVSVIRRGAHVEVAVHDRGRGISSDDLEHIFDRFYRADAARSHDGGGSGLGLAIVAWTVRRHGGDVRANSTLGAGTTITISLPAVR
jgi:signal transduction histidine kinase